MCDYSLSHKASRPAKVGEKLTTTIFPDTITRGFSAPGESNVAVCVLPGTEIAFDKHVKLERSFVGFLAAKSIPHKTAVFRQVDKDKPAMHHDALEFPDGLVVKLTNLVEGQTATVLQLPAAPKTPAQAEEQRRAAYT